MPKSIHKEAKEKMKKGLEALEQEFSTLRTGRASLHLLDPVVVEAYGTTQPLKAIASLSTPDAHTILITPWDKTQVGAIEKAILAANLGVTPNSDGKMIRISIPTLTEDRRKEIVKTAHKMSEDGRVAVRNVRRHAKDAFKKLNRAKELSDDEMSVALDELQDVTDDCIKKIDDSLSAKEKDLMEL